MEPNLVLSNGLRKLRNDRGKQITVDHPTSPQLFFFPVTAAAHTHPVNSKRIRIFLLRVDGRIFESGKNKIGLKNIRTRVDRA